MRFRESFRAVSAKAPQVAEIYALAPVGRGFTCSILPRALPWAISLLALQAALSLPPRPSDTPPSFPAIALKAAEPSARRRGLRWVLAPSPFGEGRGEASLPLPLWGGPGWGLPYTTFTSGSISIPNRSFTSWRMASHRPTMSSPRAPPRFTSTSACFS